MNADFFGKGTLRFAVENAGIGAAIAVSIAWVLFLGGHGGELTQDSIMYLKSGSFMHYDGLYNTTVTVWPPLFPFVLSLAMNFTPWPAAAASWTCALLFGATLISFALFLKRLFRHALFELSFLAVLLSLPAVWDVHRYVWSESLFTCMLLGHFYCMYRYTLAGQPAFLVTAALTGSCAALTKYTGMAIWIPFLSVCAMGLVFAKHRRLRLWNLASGGICVLPSVLWLIRNYLTDGTFFGDRSGTGVTFMDNFKDLVFTVERDFNRCILILCLAAGVFAALCLFQKLRNIIKGKKGEATTPGFVTIYYIASFIFVYLGFLLYAASTSNINRISSRFLVPMYPLMLMATAIAVSKARHIPQTLQGRIGMNFLLLFAVTLAPMMNLKTVSQKLSAFSHSEKAQDAYLSVGFDQTPVAAKVRRYLAQRLLENDKVLFSALYNRRRHRHHLAYGFFTRPGVFDADKLGDVRFENLAYPTIANSQNYLLQRSECNLHFEKDGKQRTLLFRNHDISLDFKRLSASLYREMRQHQLSQIVFLVMKPGSQKEGMSLSDEKIRGALPGGLQLKQTNSFGPFTFYLFVEYPESR